MADVDGQVERVGKPLKLLLPHVRAIAVAAAGIRRDEQLASPWVALLADLLPPRFDRLYGKYWRVVVDAHTHEAIVGGQIVDAVGDRLAHGIAWEVVYVHQLGLAGRLPLTAAVLEVADQLLLLRVDGNHGHAALDAALCLGIDMLELGVAIGVLRAL